jgi:hypothetical protein
MKKSTRKKFLHEKYQKFQYFVVHHNPLVFGFLLGFAILGPIQAGVLGLLTCIPFIALLIGYYLNWTGRWN